MRLLDLPNDLALTLDAENLSDIDAATDLPLDAALAIDTAPRVRNGAEALLDTLVACGVDTIFGYPGGAALPLYDALHGEPVSYTHLTLPTKA